MMYLAKRIRPDLLLACSYLASRVDKTKTSDMKKLTYLLGYLKGTADGCMRMSHDDWTMKVYADAAFAIHEDYKSQSGILIYIGDCLIVAKSRKQDVPATSSTEAELYAVTEAIKDARCVYYMLEELGISGVPEIYQDNTSTMKLISMGTNFNKPTRHIGSKFFYAKELIEQKEIELKYLPSEEMIADGLTKPISAKKARSIQEKLLLVFPSKIQGG